MKELKKKIRFIQHYSTILLKSGISSANKYKEDHAYLNQNVDSRVLHLQKYEQDGYIFQKQVKISILTPLFNTQELFLRELIESVQAQTYANWELVLCDASDEMHTNVQTIVKEYQMKDARIVYHKLNENKGISDNTNVCIEKASGDYLALLDHDDILHPSALFEVMKEIEQGADFIYTDEVKYFGNVEKIEERSYFNLKPGFSPEELKSHNFICHFNVYSKELLMKLKEPYYRNAFDGSQDHDMVLRLTRMAQHIVHIPKVLYYWRFHEQSVSMNLDSKSYAIDAAHRAIEDAWKEEGIKGSVESNLPYQTIYKTDIEIQNPLVSILFFGNKENQERILENTSYQNIETIYVNDSFNEAFEQAKGDYILTYNMNLIPMNKDWIEHLLMYAQFEDIGAVGPMIQNFDGSIWDAGSVFDGTGIFDIGQHYWNFDEGYEACLKYVRATSLLSKDCMLFNRQDVDMYASDLDICVSLLEKGKRNIWTCFSSLKAIDPINTKNVKLSKDFVDQHPIVKQDPLYNPGWKTLKLM